MKGYLHVSSFGTTVLTGEPLGHLFIKHWTKIFATLKSVAIKSARENIQGIR